MKETTSKKSTPLKNNLLQIKLERQMAFYLKQNLSVTEILSKMKNHSDLESLSQFLYNSGSHKKSLELSRELLKDHKPIAWTFILPLVIKSKVKINKSEANTLYHTWLKDYAKKHPSIFSCQRWAEYSLEFSNHLNIYLENLKERNTSEDDKLLESLDFLKAQGLIDEESKVIQTLLAKDPKNKKYKDLQQSIKERRAIKVVTDQKMALYKNRVSDTKKSHFIPENTDLKQRWSKVIQKLSQKKEEQTKNLSLFLYFLGWPDAAINLLTTKLKDLSDYWFYLDWLMETGQYTKSLDLINQLLNQMKDAESVFPLIYTKSQTLYYLGKKEEAIEHLNSILQVKPDYKNAQSLLEKWTKH